MAADWTVRSSMRASSRLTAVIRAPSGQEADAAVLGAHSGERRTRQAKRHKLVSLTRPVAFVKVNGMVWGPPEVARNVASHSPGSGAKGMWGTP